MPGSFQTLVICTGNSVVTITLDATGTPVSDTEIVTEHCIQGEADFTVASYLPQWQKASFEAHRLDALVFTPRAGLAPELRSRQSRAPPFV